MFPIINKRETGINIRRIMDQHGATVKEVQEYLGLGSVQSVYHWLNGISMPTIDNLYALSDLFQTPIDAIVCGNRAPLVAHDTSERGDLRSDRICVYYEKLKELRVA